jgi:hypothetical protein
MSSAKYVVGGTIDNPDIQFLSIFDDTVRKKAAAKDSSADSIEVKGKGAKAKVPES